MTSPIERMIDEACGYTPDMKAKVRAAKERDDRRHKIMIELFDACESWYNKTNIRNTDRLRAAILAMLDEGTGDSKCKA